MKCKVCRGHAVIDVRRHNAAFCGDHYVDHVRGQVARSIKEFGMFEPEERLLVAVSGGKDSLALWEILSGLGYDTTGFYLDLGIGGYSARSKEAVTAFAQNIGAPLVVRSLSIEHGYTVPQLARLTGRVPCSGCGLNKRYEFNRAALEGGFNVLVTGHNLDDEVATLFGNVLHWNMDMLARQAPVLEERVLGLGEAADRVLVKKVKPLVRLAERETAAYAVLRGIDYVVEECPMVEGNTQHRLKKAMTMLEEASPGTKQQFLFGFLKSASRRFDEVESGDPLVACAKCGGPTVVWEQGDQPVCSFCKTKSLVAARRMEPPPPRRRAHRRVG
jgi:tRNA-5-methyluridine54 2-sulfurtransferase